MLFLMGHTLNGKDKRAEVLKFCGTLESIGGGFEMLDI